MNANANANPDARNRAQRLPLALLLTVILLAATPARAQDPETAAAPAPNAPGVEAYGQGPARPRVVLGPLVDSPKPIYGTAWGYASHGQGRAFSNYSSPYGANHYRQGYGVVLGPNIGARNQVGEPQRGGRHFYGAGGYATYPASPSATWADAPPIGVYAPSLGPGGPPVIFNRPTPPFGAPRP